VWVRCVRREFLVSPDIVLDNDSAVLMGEKGRREEKRERGKEKARRDKREREKEEKIKRQEKDKRKKLKRLKKVSYQDSGGRCVIKRRS
jgi:hypothetical protein